MSKTEHTLILIGIIVIGTIGSVYAYNHFIAINTKQGAINFIARKHKWSDEMKFLNRQMDDKYLIAWANALEEGLDTFFVENKYYNTSDGRAYTGEKK